MRELRIAVALMRNPRGKILLVRKRGTSAFMQPGGKIEPGEAPDAALARELHEELGLDVAPATLRPLGQARAPAANEPGVTIVADIFELACDRPLRAQAEIDEMIWIDPASARDLPLAPLTRDHILPMVEGVDRRPLPSPIKGHMITS